MKKFALLLITVVAGSALLTSSFAKEPFTKDELRKIETTKCGSAGCSNGPGQPGNSGPTGPSTGRVGPTGPILPPLRPGTGTDTLIGDTGKSCKSYWAGVRFMKPAMKEKAIAACESYCTGAEQLSECISRWKTMCDDSSKSCDAAKQFCKEKSSEPACKEFCKKNDCGKITDSEKTSCEPCDACKKKHRIVKMEAKTVSLKAGQACLDEKHKLCVVKAEAQVKECFNVEVNHGEVYQTCVNKTTEDAGKCRDEGFSACSNGKPAEDKDETDPCQKECDSCKTSTGSNDQDKVTIDWDKFKDQWHKGGLELNKHLGELGRKINDERKPRPTPTVTSKPRPKKPGEGITKDRETDRVTNIRDVKADELEQGRVRDVTDVKADEPEGGRTSGVREVKTGVKAGVKAGVKTGIKTGTKTRTQIETETTTQQLQK